MLLNGKLVELDQPATFYEDRFNHGTFFPHLSQAVRHAISIPSARQQDTASIVTQSGEMVQSGHGVPDVFHIPFKTSSFWN